MRPFPGTSTPLTGTLGQPQHNASLNVRAEHQRERFQSLVDVVAPANYVRHVVKHPRDRIDAGRVDLRQVAGRRSVGGFHPVVKGMLFFQPDKFLLEVSFVFSE
jgi:hypothetical protein